MLSVNCKQGSVPWLLRKLTMPMSTPSVACNSNITTPTTFVDCTRRERPRVTMNKQRLLHPPATHLWSLSTGQSNSSRSHRHWTVTHQRRHGANVDWSSTTCVAVVLLECLSSPRATVRYYHSGLHSTNIGNINNGDRWSPLTRAGNPFPPQNGRIRVWRRWGWPLQIRMCHEGRSVRWPKHHCLGCYKPVREN